MKTQLAVQSNEVLLDQSFADPGQSPAVGVFRPPRCRHLSATGRQCRLSQVSELGFCSKHLNDALAAESKLNEALAMELLGDRENFKTAVAVNDFIGKAIRLFIQKRLSRGDANTLIRFAQLLVCTLRPMETEYRAVGGRESWEEMIAFNLPIDAFGGSGQYPSRENRTGSTEGELETSESGGANDGEQIPASEENESDSDVYAEEVLLDSEAEEDDSE